MHKHTAYQTLMQQPHCWLSDPVCAGDWTNHRYACCEAFYRYKEGCLTPQPLLSVLASYCPCRGSGDRHWMLECNVGLGVLGGEGHEE